MPENFILDFYHLSTQRIASSSAEVQTSVLAIYQKVISSKDFLDFLRRNKTVWLLA